MLFLLYVNELPKAVKTSKVACFADDTKLLKQIDNLQDSVGLQNDINNLNSWQQIRVWHLTKLSVSASASHGRKHWLNIPML